MKPTPKADVVAFTPSNLPLWKCQTPDCKLRARGKLCTRCFYIEKGRREGYAEIAQWLRRDAFDCPTCGAGPGVCDHDGTELRSNEAPLDPVKRPEVGDDIRFTLRYGTAPAVVVKRLSPTTIQVRDLRNDQYREIGDADVVYIGEELTGNDDEAHDDGPPATRSDKAKATPLCNGCGHPRSDHADPEKHPCGEHQTCCHNCACVEYVDTDTEAVAFERGFAAGEEHAKALDCANTREKNLAQALGSLGYGDRIEEWAKEPPSWAGGNRPEVKP